MTEADRNDIAQKLRAELPKDGGSWLPPDDCPDPSCRVHGYCFGLCADYAAHHEEVFARIGWTRKETWRDHMPETIPADLDDADGFGQALRAMRGIGLKRRAGLTNPSFEVDDLLPEDVWLESWLNGTTTDAHRLALAKTLVILKAAS